MKFAVTIMLLAVSAFGVGFNADDEAKTEAAPGCGLMRYDISKAIPALIKGRTLKLGIPDPTIAEKLGIHPTQWGRIRQGRLAIWSASLALEIADLLKISPNYFLRLCRFDALHLMNPGSLLDKAIRRSGKRRDQIAAESGVSEQFIRELISFRGEAFDAESQIRADQVANVVKMQTPVHGEKIPETPRRLFEEEADVLIIFLTNRLPDFSFSDEEIAALATKLQLPNLTRILNGFDYFPLRAVTKLAEFLHVDPSDAAVAAGYPANTFVSGYADALAQEHKFSARTPYSF